jgi:hypothetical protein
MHVFLHWRVGLTISGPNGQKGIVGPENYAQIADAINQVDGS